VARFKAGDMVIVDWRGGAPPKEPKRLRPAVVVEDDALFGPDYPNVLVVPLTGDARLANPDLAVTIDPTPENGCQEQCFALAASVTSVSAKRVRDTQSHIKPHQLGEIRRRISEAIGLA
jgi:mRNA interferase MazF